MGRYYWDKKEEADSLKQINIVKLNKYGYFKRGGVYGTLIWSSHGEKIGAINIQSFIGDSEHYLKLIYSKTDNNTGKSRDFDYKISLTTTPCYFGGKRYWFVCPCSANSRYCCRRVGALYMNGDYFACRHCYNLTYSSRNLSGISKVVGQVVGIPELDKIEAGIKRKLYAGKMTRRYKSYLKKRNKNLFQIRTMTDKFGPSYGY